MKTISTHGKDRAAIIGDLHSPYEDRDSLEVFLGWLRKEKIQKLFLNGDIMDMPQLSKFDQEPSDKDSLQDQVEHTRKILGSIVEAAGDAQTIYIEGNHEKRLKKYLIRNAKELWGIVTLKEILRLDELGIKLIDDDPESFVRYGNTMLGHFDMARKGSGMTARGLMQRFGGSVNVLQNHVHRGGVIYQTTPSGTVWSAENFCLCGMEPKYLSAPDWQQGFSEVETMKNGRQEITQHLISKV